jgi:hypothetical protein
LNRWKVLLKLANVPDDYEIHSEVVDRIKKKFLGTCHSHDYGKLTISKNDANQIGKWESFISAHI